MSLTLSSPAFRDKNPIPKIYTCDGENISPPLEWSGAPSNTKTFVLIVDDPDAPVGVWDHWILYNIPPNTNKLEQNANIRQLPAETKEGVNSWGSIGYGGPCPPKGSHRYYFKLYALDSEIEFDSGMQREDIEKSMQGHIIENAELIGYFERK